MEEPKKIEIQFNIMDAAMKLGLMLGVYQVAKLALAVVAVHGSTLAGVLLILVAIGVPAFLWWIVREYRNRNCKLLFPFALAWLTSILTCLFASVIAGVATYIYMQYLDNGAFASGILSQLELVKESANAAQANGTADAESVQVYLNQIEAVSKLLASLTPKQAVMQMFNNNLFWGNLFSLVVGFATSTYALFKKKN